jgi:hypothetical protein
MRNDGEVNEDAMIHGEIGSQINEAATEASCPSPILPDAEALKVALRVLNGMMKGQLPTAGDIAALREFTPEASHVPIDELATFVIRETAFAVALTRAISY